MFFSIALMFVGFLIGMLLVSIYEPVALKKRVLPDVSKPPIIMKQESINNGCFRMIPREVPCPAEYDSLNLLSLQHK